MFNFLFLSSKNKLGFSLIELLVVVAIIGTLSTVGIVAYTGFIEHSKNKVIDSNINQSDKIIEAEFLKCDLSPSNVILDNYKCSSSQPPSNKNVINFLNKQNLKNPITNSNAVNANACNPGNISVQSSKCVGTFQLSSINSNGKKINNIYSTIWTPVNTNLKTCWKTVNTNTCNTWTNVNSSNNTVWKKVVTGTSNVWKNVRP